MGDRGQVRRMGWQGSATPSDPLVVLVDERDQPVGVCAKSVAHRKALLHRAFSVFLAYDGKMLLQKRAVGKYHSAGLWCNACCSHPEPDEDVISAAHRRLFQELGIPAGRVRDLREVLSFSYRTDFESGLSEHEFDHVLVGSYGGPFDPDPQEVADLRWVSIRQLREEVRAHPERFAYWFLEAFEKVARRLEDADESGGL
ncbi:isopentenyl-diphosphate Delta-isomerase [Rubneribacter sp.]